MVFRPSRRQMLSAAFFAAASGTLVPVILSRKPASAHPATPAAAGPIPLNLLPLSNIRQNTYPIVLVHGYGGFGRDGLHGLVKYWGGLHGDIQQDLVNHGFQTVTAAMGPFTSNWDRACELYAQIKGGTVDYGAAHAQKFGHARFGRTFPGLFPQWSSTNKVHLITHSMGAQTARRLAQLMGQGSAEEIAATPPGELSPLFTGGKANWIESILTISGTHNGSSLTDLAHRDLPFASQLITFGALFNSLDRELIGYDFNMDQWGITRQPGESLTHFLTRVFASGFSKTLDTGEHDLTPDGGAALNGVVTAQPDNFLFTLNTLTTHANGNGVQVADKGTDPLISSAANFIGSHTKNVAGQIPITPAWWPNDGAVSTNFQIGPILNTTDVIATYNGTVTRGMWYPLSVLNMVDHGQVIGLGAQDPKPMFRTLAAFLASLPS